MLSIKIKKGPLGVTPEYKTEGAAGMDLCSAERYCLAPGEYHAFNTDISIQLPPGVEAQIRPRSGLAAKHGVTVLNAPGTIDNDYIGLIKVILINQGEESIIFNVGDRIAQMVIAKVVVGRFQEVNELDDTARGEGGLGSTGI